MLGSKKSKKKEKNELEFIKLGSKNPFKKCLII